MERIPIYRPMFDYREKDQLIDCVDREWLSGGVKVKEFEQKIANLCNVRYGVACSNGTIALYLGLLALGIGVGDEVIVPDFTFIASANAVTWTGAKPVFCDVIAETLNMDVKSVESKITPKTKAIIPVHIYGVSCDMLPLMELAKKYKLKVIEDACQGIGVTYQFEHVGGFGEVGALSFYADKTLTCLPAETRILTVLKQKGRGGSRTKPIKDFKIGDKVVSYNEKTSEKEIDTVEECFVNQASSLLNIKLDNGNELKLTGNHPIYIVDKGWIEASSVSTGDRVIQYVYYGLNQRITGLAGTGKSLSERWGEERFIKWQQGHSEKISKLHNSHDSGYARMDNVTRYKHISEGNKLFHQSEKGKLIDTKQSKRMKEKYADPNSIYNNSDYLVKRITNSNLAQQKPEVKEKKRVAGVNNWKNSQYRELVTRKVNEVRGTKEYLEAYAKGLLKKPNKSELKLGVILNEVCPEFQYNGDFRLGVAIGHYIPDYVNTNGKKKVIEMFGGRWHKEEEVLERKERMAKLGWECLIIWEEELKDKEVVANKVKTFSYNPNVELVKVVAIDKIDQPTTVYNIRTAKNNNYFVYGVLVHNCGEGGMVLTNDKDIARKCLILKHQGRTGRGWYIHDEIGYNFRMTDMQAGVGLAQLEKLPEILSNKKRHSQLYKEKLSKFMLPISNEDVPFRHNIFVDDPDGLIKYLDQNAIDAKRVFYPLHRQPCYNVGGDFPNTEYAYAHGVSLPSSPLLTYEQISYICGCINAYEGVL